MAVLFEILDQKIDTSTATGNAFLQMLDVFEHLLEKDITEGRTG